MALSDSVSDSLKEAEGSLRNALAFAARNERTMVCQSIADILHRIDILQSADKLMDSLENLGRDGENNPHLF